MRLGIAPKRLGVPPLRLGSAQRARVSNFNIADAALGTGGFWAYFDDAAALAQEEDGSGSVSAGGTSVGYAQSSDGDPFVQAIASARPKFVVGLGLLFDAFDDLITRTPAAGAGPGSCSVFIRARLDAPSGESGTEGTLAYGSDGVSWLGLVQEEGGATPNNGSGTATCVVDGTVTCATRDDLYVALSDGAFHTIESQTTNLAGWPVFAFGGLPVAFYYWGGIVSRVVTATTDALAADTTLRASILTDLAEIS